MRLYFQIKRKIFHFSAKKLAVFSDEEEDTVSIGVNLEEVKLQDAVVGINYVGVRVDLVQYESIDLQVYNNV